MYSEEIFWKKLRKKVVNNDKRNFVRAEGVISESFDTNSEVRKGSLISPLLFIALMDNVARELRRKKT